MFQTLCAIWLHLSDSIVFLLSPCTLWSAVCLPCLLSYFIIPAVLYFNLVTDTGLCYAANVAACFAISTAFSCHISCSSVASPSVILVLAIAADVAFGTPWYPS